VQDAFEELCSGSFLFEACLKQHPDLSVIYPHSVNTLRFITFTPRQGEVRIVSALLRLGVGGSWTDNSSSGGIFIKVHLHSGALASYARKLHRHGGSVHRTHPDTGVRLEGLIVPYFERAKDTVRAAGNHLPYRLVGWDVAVAEDGPVLIEGNHNPHIIGAEIADGGYRKNEVFREFLREEGLD
jgi:hypothetical protein